jgi:predicted methyltransferase
MRRMALILAALPAALALAGCATTPAAPRSSAADYSAALADAARPEADRARDAARHPADILAFAQIRPGQRVGDFVMGGGYFTRLLAGAVGSAGHVYAFQPAEFVAFRAQYGTDQATVDAAYANVTAVRSPFAAPAFPTGLDAIITVQNYHDLHLAPFPADTASRAATALFNALKPGGVLLVVDHAATAGSGTRDSDTLHRIDIASVRSELTAAGFVEEAHSDVLRAPADPHTANVFDPAIRGRTDQFMLRFRRPAP